MTAWNKLLVATTRLLDLHDSAHEPGSPFVQVTQEQRRGLRDGYWLDLGCLLLDYLLEVDFATNSAFVTQRRCLAHVLLKTFQFYPLIIVRTDNLLSIIGGSIVNNQETKIVIRLIQDTVYGSAQVG